MPKSHKLAQIVLKLMKKGNLTETVPDQQARESLD